MKILISSDTACDLPKDMLDKYNTPLIPLPITLGSDTYYDNVDISPKDIFDYVDNNNILPKTSAINEHDYSEFFHKHSPNYDAIIHFTLSHKVSACNQNANNAKASFDNVYVVDTMSLSTGMALLIRKACELNEQGKSVQQIIDTVTALRDKVVTSFVIEKLDYLHKGGRCSSLQLLGANILKIRPSILMTDGKLKMNKKYKGKIPQVVANYISDTLKDNPNYDKSQVYLTYSSASTQMLEEAKKSLSDKFKNVYESRTSGTITSHCGPHTLGIIFATK